MSKKKKIFKIHKLFLTNNYFRLTNETYFPKQTHNLNKGLCNMITCLPGINMNVLWILISGQLFIRFLQGLIKVRGMEEFLSATDIIVSLVNTRCEEYHTTKLKPL